MTESPFADSTKFLVAPLGPESLEGLREMRNLDEVRNWFFDDRVVTAEQQAAWFAAYLQRDSDLMWVALEGPDVVGAVALYDIDASRETAEFGRLMVHPGKARGRGLGRSLTRHAVREARAMGITRLQLDVKEDNVAARRIYEAEGFSVVSDVDGNVTMVLEL